MISPRLRAALAALLPFGLVLPFLNKPAHIDDANFLILARGAAADPWRPHGIEINWQGTTEQAFDVLSNPPGVGWWLAPLHDAPVWAQHLAMLPWLALALWGCGRLGQALAGRALAGVLLLGTAPVVVLAGQALTPDLPLFACAAAGVGGFLTARRRYWAWALLAGAAALFRYSGLCLAPLLVFAGWQRRGLRGALEGAAAALPFLGLALHDLHAYGQVHFVAMTGFQGVSNTGRDVFRKGAASLAMLGGAGALPVLALRGRGWAGAALGALVGGIASQISGQTFDQAAATTLFCAAGGAALGVFHVKHRDDRLLAAWAFGGLAFLLALRFSAARYWLPFLPGVVLMGLRLRPSRGRLAAAVALNVAVALGLSVDDHAMAKAQLAAAEQTAAIAAAAGCDPLADPTDDPPTFAGHWGWQRHMEAAGWRPLEEDGPPGPLHAAAESPWPQSVAEDACLVELARLEVADIWPGPRAHTRAGAANLHAFVVAGDPPTETYAPWTLAGDPYDRVIVYERCDRAAARTEQKRCEP